MLSPLEAGTVAGRTSLTPLSLAGGLPELALPRSRLSQVGIAPTIPIWLIATRDMRHRAVSAILAGPGTPEWTHDHVGRGDALARLGGTLDRRRSITARL
jgi:hypothetical protein